MSQAALIETPAHKRVKHISAQCPQGIEPGTVVNFEWPSAAKSAFKRPPMLAPSDWAAKHRINDDSGQRPGPWRNDYARHLCGPMDVFSLPFIREIVIVAPPQTGKTEIMFNQLASVIDQRPGPALLVYDQQDAARLMCTTRVKNMINLSPRLVKYTTGKPDDFGNYLIKLRNMRLHFAWSTSVSTLANKPIKWLFLDEVEKYEATGKREAGPVALARKRTRSFEETAKTVLGSSPGLEDGEITVAYNRVQARFEYAVRCVDCGGLHVMFFSQDRSRGERQCGVIWPEDERDPEVITAQKLARYVCPDCGSVWDDYKRNLAVRAGHWRELESKLELMAYCERHRPRSVGFHYSTLIAPQVSLSETAAKFVLSMQELKLGRIDAFKDWLNGYMAEVWREDHSPRKVDEILALRDERPAGIVPDGRKVAALLAQVDTQDDGFYYEIRAWGYGQEMESWEVRSGFVESFDALDEVLWIPYADAHGVRHYVELAVIDSQGHRTREVYEWSIRHRGKVIPLKGEQSMKEPYKFSDKVEFWPGTNQRIPGGLRLLLVNTKYYKDALHTKLQIPGCDPGAWHYNSAYTEAQARQMCVEYVDARGIWVCPKGSPNHYWDVSVYGYCLADHRGVRYMLPEGADDAPDDGAPEAALRRSSVGWR